MKLGRYNDKFLPKDRLIEILEQLPDNTFITVSAVGSLLAAERDKNGNPEYIGHVDFLLDDMIVYYGTTNLEEDNDNDNENE